MKGQVGKDCANTLNDLDFHYSHTCQFKKIGPYQGVCVCVGGGGGVRGRREREDRNLLLHEKMFPNCNKFFPFRI